MNTPKLYSQQNWSFLKEKDPVEVIYPATGPLSKDHMLKIKHIVEEYGLTVIYDENAFDAQKSPFHYYANDLEGRLHNVMNALNGKYGVLWAFRGGYGSVEVIERLETLGYLPPSKPKIFIGASDITHFHALAAKWGWISFHAPGIGGAREGYKFTPHIKINVHATLKDVVDVLLGKKQTLEYVFDLIHNPASFSKKNTLFGSVIGGNATLVKETQGTLTELNTKNRFVFLEDTKEDPKRLNRVFVSLLRGGFFDDVKAILFGSLLIDHAEDEKEAAFKTINLFIKDHLLPRGIDVPIFYSPEFGHGDYNHVLPFGTEASLEVKDKVGILKVKTNQSFKEAP